VIKIIHKTLFFCPDVTLNKQAALGVEITLNAASITYNGLVDGNGYVSTPSWATVFNGFPLSDTVLQISASTIPTDKAKYYFSWTVSRFGLDVEYLMEVVYDPVCSKNVNGCERARLLFLNREGGYSEIMFAGKTTFETRIPDAVLYLQPNKTQRVAGQEDVYEAFIFTTGDIPQDALEYLEALKYTPAAYLVDGDNIEPLIVDRSSFVKRRTGDKIFDVSIACYKAKQINIQSQ